MVVCNTKLVRLEMNDAIRDIVNPNGTRVINSGSLLRPNYENGETREEIRITKVNAPSKHRVGDPVMCDENLYEYDSDLKKRVLRVANGTMGRLESDAFSNFGVVYENGFRDMAPFRSIFQAAYAITNHKSQGSEFDHVVFVCDTTEMAEVESGMIFTAISRAKRTCVVIGTRARIQTALCIDSSPTSSSSTPSRIPILPFGAKRRKIDSGILMGSRFTSAINTHFTNGKILVDSSVSKTSTTSGTNETNETSAVNPIDSTSPCVSKYFVAPNDVSPSDGILPARAAFLNSSIPTTTTTHGRPE